MWISSTYKNKLQKAFRITHILSFSKSQNFCEIIKIISEDLIVLKKVYKIFYFHVFFFLFPIAISEINDDNKIYNFSDILPSSLSEFSQQQQQREKNYLYKNYHHPVPTLDSITPIGGSSEKKRERYYIYSHTIGATHAEEKIKTKKKSKRNRKERSTSTLTMDR
jgi:hypothetical protein